MFFKFLKPDPFNVNLLHLVGKWILFVCFLKRKITFLEFNFMVVVFSPFNLGKVPSAFLFQKVQT